MTLRTSSTALTAPSLQSDQLLVLALAVLLWEEHASRLLVLALLYIAM